MSLKKDFILLKNSLYLKAVINNGKISRAAIENNIKASNLSQALKEFEDAIGVPLLVRRKDGIVATSVGLQIYKLSCQLEKSLSDFYRIKDFYTKKELVTVYFPEEFGFDFKSFEDKNIKLQRLDDFSNVDFAVFIGKSPLKEGYILKEHTLIKDRIKISLSFAFKSSCSSAERIYKFLIASDI